MVEGQRGSVAGVLDGFRREDLIVAVQEADKPKPFLHAQRNLRLDSLGILLT